AHVLAPAPCDQQRKVSAQHGRAPGQAGELDRALRGRDRVTVGVQPVGDLLEAGVEVVVALQRRTFRELGGRYARLLDAGTRCGREVAQRVRERVGRGLEA